MPLSISTTEAERRYDALKDGSAYAKPAPATPELPSHLLALRAQIDAETDPDVRKRLICRMADQVLGLSDDAPAPPYDAGHAAGVVAAAAIDPLFHRAGFVLGQLSYMLTNELERAHAERLLTLLEAMVNPAPVRVSYDWIDEDEELNTDGRGEIAYTNYLAGQPKQDIVEICFSHRPIEVTAGTNTPIVYMFGRDELHLSEVERTLPILLALLASPELNAMRVKAAREARQ